MKLRILKYVVVLCVAVIFAQISASAQKFRPGSDLENMVLSAVELLNENKVDAATSVTASMLSEKWEQIRHEIDKIPNPEQLTNLYKDLGVKATLPQIDVPAELEETLLANSPMVRNRLTLMRLRSSIGGRS